MATIGSFTQNGTDFNGTIRTLQLQGTARIVSNPGAGERGPHHLVFVNTIEIGAGWNRVAEETGRPYISIRLDDPSFASAIDANLFDLPDGTYALIWTRSRR